MAGGEGLELLLELWRVVAGSSRESGLVACGWGPGLSLGPCAGLGPCPAGRGICRLQAQKDLQGELNSCGDELRIRPAGRPITGALESLALSQSSTHSEFHQKFPILK